VINIPAQHYLGKGKRLLIDAAGLIFTCVGSSSDEQSEQLGITLGEVVTVFSWVDNLRNGSQILAMLQSISTSSQDSNTNNNENQKDSLK
jgi:hypothetical protein